MQHKQQVVINIVKREMISVAYCKRNFGVWKIIILMPYRVSKILHMFDGEDIDNLNALIARQNTLEALAPVGKQNGSSVDVWLIYMPFADTTYLKNIFRRTPLRLDSQVFAFFEANIETTCKFITYKQKIYYSRTQYYNHFSFGLQICLIMCFSNQYLFDI